MEYNNNNSKTIIALTPSNGKCASASSCTLAYTLKDSGAPIVLTTNEVTIVANDNSSPSNSFSATTTLNPISISHQPSLGVIPIVVTNRGDTTLEIQPVVLDRDYKAYAEIDNNGPSPCSIKGTTQLKAGGHCLFQIKPIDIATMTTPNTTTIKSSNPLVTITANNGGSTVITAVTPAASTYKKTLYAAGDFSVKGATEKTINNLAAYNVVDSKGQWSAVGGQLSWEKQDIKTMLLTPDGHLVVGGKFTIKPSSYQESNIAPTYTNIASFDGATWNNLKALNTDFTGGVNALAWFDDKLFVGGSNTGSAPLLKYFDPANTSWNSIMNSSLGSTKGDVSLLATGMNSSSPPSPSLCGVITPKPQVTNTWCLQGTGGSNDYTFTNKNTLIGTGRGLAMDVGGLWLVGTGPFTSTTPPSSSNNKAVPENVYSVVQFRDSAKYQYLTTTANPATGNPVTSFFGDGDSVSNEGVSSIEVVKDNNNRIWRLYGNGSYNVVSLDLGGELALQGYSSTPSDNYSTDNYSTDNFKLYDLYDYWTTNNHTYLYKIMNTASSFSGNTDNPVLNTIVAGCKSTYFKKKCYPYLAFVTINVNKGLTVTQDALAPNIIPSNNIGTVKIILGPPYAASADTPPPGSIKKILLVPSLVMASAS